MKERLRHLVPFNVPFVPSSALVLIEDALKRQTQQGNGYYSNLVESEILQKYNDRYEVLLMPSCTAAIELSFMLIDLCPGDEVIVPSFTFTSVATAITKFWATPVFCDINLQTGNIEPELIEELITPRTRAISWVNYGGIAPDPAKIRELADKHGLFLVEDAAHNFGVLSSNQEKVTGDFVTFSFHATKNIQCGEGGALLVKNPGLHERAHIIREKGTNRKEFSQGKVSKYSWVDRGSSFLLPEINSALLLSQLDSFQEIQNTRRAICRNYMTKLTEIQELAWQLFQDTDRAGHLYAMIAPNTESRDKLIKIMKEKDITIVSHYEDLQSSPAGQRYARKSPTCLNSRELSSRIIRLPVFPGIEAIQSRIITETIESINQIKSA